MNNIPPISRPLKSACSRCGKVISKVSAERARTCFSCNRQYHRKCYLADTGAIESQLHGCVCCLSRVITAEKLTMMKDVNPLAFDFLQHGFCVIPLGGEGVEREEVAKKLTEWREQAVMLFKTMKFSFDLEVELGNHATTTNEGYSNFRMRGKGRYEMLSDRISKNVIPLVESSPNIQKTLRYLLSPDGESDTPKIKLMSSGCFFSLIGSSAQSFHTDGPKLSTVEDLFPYAVNIFVPLVDVDCRNGTEFVPGTQRVHLGTGVQPKTVTPTVPVGYAVLFDYRVEHRGRGNLRSHERPCYYVTYSQSWYQDIFNFSTKRYKRTLTIEPFLESRAQRLQRRRTE